MGIKLLVAYAFSAFSFVAFSVFLRFQFSCVFMRWYMGANETWLLVLK